MITGSFITASEEETLSFGRAAGEKSQPRDVWCLSGPLGAGKTAFVKGLALGLGYEGPVTSPTFGLHHIYRGGGLPLHHFDWYRLKSPEEVVDLGFWEWAEKGGVTVVEWSDRFPEMMPPSCIKLAMEIVSHGERRLFLEASDTLTAQRVEELLKCWPP